MTAFHCLRRCGSLAVILPLVHALLLAGPAYSNTPSSPAPSGVVPPPPTTQQQKSLLLQMQDAFTKIAETVEPTVVNIKSERIGGTSPGEEGLPPTLPGVPHRPRRSEATGSGVIVRADGYILTNDHVVDSATGGIVTVTLADGREYKGKVYQDYKSDLAVVKVDPGAAGLPVATFADSTQVRPGQWAIAVGSPFDLQNTMTVGVISAVSRHQIIPGETTGAGRYYPDLLQTDAAINPGNSGGPLFNIDGQVVGINVAIESPVEGSAGVGFAIPSSIARQIMNSLISQGKVVRGYLGLAPDDLTPVLQQQYGQKVGAFVRDVSLDSPAGKAGLQAADIVTSFDGRPIKDEISLRLAISDTPPGKVVSVAYVRDGHTGVASVKIAAAPAQPGDNAAPGLPAAAPPKSKLGLGIRDLTSRDRQSVGAPSGTLGVYVASVVPGGSAETAALSVGMVLNGAIIQKINQIPVADKAGFEKAVASVSNTSTVTLVVLYLTEGQLHQSALTVRL